MEEGSWRGLKYRIIEVMLLHCWTINEIQLINDQLASNWKDGEGQKMTTSPILWEESEKIVRYMVQDFIIFGLRATCFGFVKVNYFWN